MKTGFLTYRSSLIHYACSGHDGIPLICFHGYGEEGLAFSFLEETLPPEYSLISIDLLFHGRTEWKEDRDFCADDLLIIIRELLNHNYSSRTLPASAVLLGFSLGGRIALSLFEREPSFFRKIILLAPDGLKLNPWYWLATQTIAGNRLFRLTMDKPGWFLGLLKAANKTGLVNSSIFKFVNYYIGDPEVRRLLYLRWTRLRKCRPHLNRIKEMIRMHGTTVRLIFGRHDRIILPAPGERFRKGIPDQCRIRVIESGHQVLQRKHAEIIREEILG